MQNLSVIVDHHLKVVAQLIFIIKFGGTLPLRKG